jgi:PAS domain S-box-containing protein
LIGRKRSEIVGKSHSILHPPEKIEGRFSRTFKQHLKEKEGQALETEVITKKGEIRDVSIKANLMEINERKFLNGIFRDITERKKAEDELKASLEEKRVLLQEVHHRVKNNMQVISSMLMLQSSFIKNNEFIDILQLCRDRIMSMALVHEKIYESTELANINFREYLEALSESLYSHYVGDREGIAMKLDVEDMFLDIDTSVPLGLIINELLTNALKHAFKEREIGELSLSLHSVDGDALELIVRDDGVGLPGDFDMDNPKTFGLQIVGLLAEKQLHGKIDIRRNGGTEFRILVEKVKDKKRA